MDAQHHDRVCELFEEACDLSEPERTRFLKEACGDDTALLREVLGLLQADEDSAMQITGVQSQWRDGIYEQLENVAPPENVGPFRILSVLGKGGMGVVYKAQRETPRRTVALKVIRPGLLTERTVQHFEREIQVLARLKHPGIAQVYEAGWAESPTGAQPYFAMELIEGESLLEYGRKHDLDVNDRLTVFRKVCEAVHHAHQRGVIHRDLKPGNILVDPQGQPKILDFGIARPLDIDGQTLTLGDFEQAVGTIPYMSPEQATQEKADLDTRSDVYSLGVVLYELLCGSLPYKVTQTAMLEAMRIVKEVPPKPLHSFDRDLAGDVETIVTKTLSKERSERYQSASELGDDIRRFLTCNPILARPPSALYQLKKFSQRHRALVGSALTLLLVIITSAITMTVLWYRADSAKALAHDYLEGLLSMSDVQVLRELESQRGTLWPRRPDKVTALEAWLAKSKDLIERLPELERTRVFLQEAKTLEIGATKKAWIDEKLDELISSIAQFKDEAIPDVTDRLEVASTLIETTIDDQEDAWYEAMEAIEGAEIYDGLMLSPQIGLIPLGPDPQSGLWEFYLPESGGPPEERDDRGRWILSEETAIIMVLMPGGPFIMGSGPSPSTPIPAEDETPNHEVVLDPFFLSKYEITQAQWIRVFGTNESYFSPDRELRFSFDHTHPAESISWHEAQEFARRMDLSIPTEAQWEYAARAGTDGRWSFGERARAEEFANLRDRQWQQNGGVGGSAEEWDDGYPAHAPVGTYAPNPFGLFDMHGNVTEWCRDAFGLYNKEAREGDGLRHEDGPDRVLRGGGFENAKIESRSASRGRQTAGSKNSDIGVRPVRVLAEDDEAE